MVTSRSVPQQTAQIFSPLAGQKRAALRFSQMGQDTESPQNFETVQQNTRCSSKRQNQIGGILLELLSSQEGYYLDESYQGRQNSRELSKTLSPPTSMPIPISWVLGSFPKSPILSIR